MIIYTSNRDPHSVPIHCGKFITVNSVTTLFWNTYAKCVCSDTTDENRIAGLLPFCLDALESSFYGKLEQCRFMSIYLLYNWSKSCKTIQLREEKRNHRGYYEPNLYFCLWKSPLQLIKGCITLNWKSTVLMGFKCTLPSSFLGNIIFSEITFFSKAGKNCSSKSILEVITYPLYWNST